MNKREEMIELLITAQINIAKSILCLEIKDYKGMKYQLIDGINRLKTTAMLTGLMGREEDDI